MEDIAAYVRGDYLVKQYSSVINGTFVIHEDELVNSYWFAKAPFIFIVVALYLLFAIRGPKWMENKEPYSLRKIMILYNIYQVAFCSLFLYCVASMWGVNISSFITGNICRPVDKPYDSYLRIHTIHGAAVYLFMKILDLPDTIFMVLRKQFTHITFLHLFHHTTMVVSMWFHLVYVRGELGSIFGIINVFVHVIMYSYYLLSAIGPRFRAMVSPYKRYVTMLQISQFGVILTIIGILIKSDCEMPPNLLSMWLFNNVLFLVLFINFYVRTFILNRNKNKKQ